MTIYGQLATHEGFLSCSKLLPLYCCAQTVKEWRIFLEANRSMDAHFKLRDHQTKMDSISVVMMTPHSDFSHIRRSSVSETNKRPTRLTRGWPSSTDASTCFFLIFSLFFLSSFSNRQGIESDAGTLPTGNFPFSSIFFFFCVCC